MVRTIVKQANYYNLNNTRPKMSEGGIRLVRLLRGAFFCWHVMVLVNQNSGDPQKPYSLVITSTVLHKE